MLVNFLCNFEILESKIMNWDAVYYYNALSLAWESVLKMTNIKIELLQNIEMNDFI